MLADSKGPAQTARMRRLICDFAIRLCPKKRMAPLILLWPITPTFDIRPWQISHSLQVYIQSLTIAPGSRLFGSVLRALDYYSGRSPGSNPGPSKAGPSYIYSCAFAGAVKFDQKVRFDGHRCSL